MHIPLKTKCFGWLFLRDRIAVRDKLQILGVVHEDENVCLFHIVGKEDNQHLFIHFDHVYSVWSRVARLWRLYFAWVEDVTTRLRCGFLHLTWVIRRSFGRWRSFRSLGIYGGFRT